MDWLDMSTAPKDGSRILIKDNEGFVYVACFLSYRLSPGGRKFKDWVIPESWQDEQGGYFEIEKPVAWMQCPK